MGESTQFFQNENDDPVADMAEERAFGHWFYLVAEKDLASSNKRPVSVNDEHAPQPAKKTKNSSSRRTKRQGKPSNGDDRSHTVKIHPFFTPEMAKDENQRTPTDKDEGSDSLLKLLLSSSRFRKQSKTLDIAMDPKKTMAPLPTTVSLTAREDASMVISPATVDTEFSLGEDFEPGPWDVVGFVAWTSSAKVIRQ